MVNEDTPLMPAPATSRPTTPSQSNSGPLLSQSSLMRKATFVETKSLIERRREAAATDEEQHRLDAVLDGLNETEGNQVTTTILALLGIILHVIGGALFLCYLEGWSFIDSIYFCIVTTTTVGYGDITPKTSIAKVFVMFYVIVSIFLISSLLATFVGSILDQQEAFLLNSIMNEEEETGSEDEEDALSDTWVPSFMRKYLEGLQLSDFYVLGFSASYLVGILVAGVLSFMFLENLPLIDSIYTTVISVTTVGFGDFEPTRDLTKGVMTLWLIFSTIGLVKVLTDFTDAAVKSKQRTMTKRLVNAQMDMKTWEDMDIDQDGQVDKTEFVTELLIRMGKVDRKECEALIKRFDELDDDKSGCISIEEVRAQFS